MVPVNMASRAQFNWEIWIAMSKIKVVFFLQRNGQTIGQMEE